MENERVRMYLAAVLVGVLTFIVYLPALNNQFIKGWDDGAYVTENRSIRSMDANLLRDAFLRFHASNWHPVTIISHALDYAVWGLDPAGHHLTSILLHALNTFLVVLLAARLLAMTAAGRPAGGQGHGGRDEVPPSSQGP